MVDVDAVCDLAAGLPGADEGTWYGAPAFRVRGKVFARVHENDADLFLIKVGPDERDHLVASQPERFMGTEHRSERDESVLMRLSATSGRDLKGVADLLAQALHRVSQARPATSHRGARRAE